MDFSAFLGTSIAATLAAVAITVAREGMAKKRKTVAHLRALLLDVAKIEELATIYLGPKTPKAPAYRMPTDFLHAALLWFAGESTVPTSTLKEFHELYGFAGEVNRCLDRLSELDSDPSATARTALHAEVDRTLLKCKNALGQAPKARDAANAAIRELAWNATE